MPNAMLTFISNYMTFAADLKGFKFHFKLHDFAADLKGVKFHFKLHDFAADLEKVHLA